MDLTTFFQKLFGYVLNIKTIVFFAILIIIYHIFLFLLRDRKIIKKIIQNYENSNNIKLDDLKRTPKVNIIIPAWNEEEIFRGCLECVKKLTYPNLKIIINAGGSTQTIKIAESYKNLENFKILYQKMGEGKIKAINDCLELISEGIVYLIDADTYLGDEIFLKTIYPLINENKSVIVVRVKPHKSIKNKNLVKYLNISRNVKFHGDTSNEINYVSQNTGLRYEVIKELKKFSEKKLSDDGLSIGSDLIKKGFKILLIDENVESFNFPNKIKGYIKQNLRWIENSLFVSRKNQKLRILKFLGMVLISLYFFLSFFLIFLDINLFLYGLILFFSIYLKRIRKIIFFKKTNKDRSISFKFTFYIAMIYYTVVDLLISIIVFLEMIFYRKAYIKRKNLLD